MTTEQTIASLLALSFKDIDSGFEGLTHEEKEAVGDAENFDDVLDWVADHTPPESGKKHSLRAYTEGAEALIEGTDLSILKEQAPDGCPNGQYIAVSIWVQDNWIDENGNLTEEGMKARLSPPLPEVPDPLILVPEPD